MGPKASAPEPVQQQAQNDDPFDIEGNFKRGIVEKLDKHFEEQRQREYSMADAPAAEDVPAAAIGSYGRDGAFIDDAGQYMAQAPAPYEDMPAYKPLTVSSNEMALMGELAGRSKGEVSSGATLAWGPRGGSVLDYPDRVAEKWSSSDMYNHYLRGGGDVTLSEIGLLDDVMGYKETIRSVGRFGSQIEAYAGDEAKRLGAGVHDIGLSYKNSYEFEPLVFALGSATLSGSFQGRLTVGASGGYSYSGSAQIKFHDIFTDPYDTFDNFKGEWNPDGAPYNINGSWSQSYSGGRKR